VEYPVQATQAAAPPIQHSRTMGSRYQNLDALRAIAVLSVLLYHYTARFEDSYTGLTGLPFHVTYGWLGVDIFFVVSGYCISMTLDRVGTVAEFWAKRIARLQPAYMVGVLVTFGCVSLIGLPGRESSALVAASNLVWLNALPRLHIPDVDGAYWSLAVELKFYFWFGLLFACFGRRSLAVAWGIFSFAACIASRVHPGLANDLLIFPYAPLFLFGIVAFSWKVQARWLSLVLVSEALALSFTSPEFKGVEVLGCIVGAGTMVLAMLTGMRVPRPVSWLGAVSYPLYLVHQNIGLLIIREMMSLSSSLRVLAACLGSIGLATLIHYSVEFRYQKPLTRLATQALLGLMSIRRLLPVRVKASC